IRIIRESITPDLVVRSFLKGEKVAEPLQYVYSQAHTQRKWQPLWYYVKQAGTTSEQVIAELRASIATNPSSRVLVVDRLAKRATRKVHPGKPTQLLREIAQGDIPTSTTPAQDLMFALAVQGLRDGDMTAEDLKAAALNSIVPRGVLVRSGSA